MFVRKFGLKEPDEVSLHTYAEAGRLDSLTIYSGDNDAVLRGTRLDQVATVEVAGIAFRPGTLARANQHDELKLATQDFVATSKLQAGEAGGGREPLGDCPGAGLGVFGPQPPPKTAARTERRAHEEADRP